MFWEGFQKRAEELGKKHAPKSQEASKSPLWKHPLVTAGGALAVGGGMYAALRKPWMKTQKLHRFLPKPVDGKPGPIKNWLNKMVHGADDILYINPKASIPKKPKKVKGIVMGDFEERQFYKGDRTMGDVKHPLLKKVIEDKWPEAQMIKKYAPEYALETHLLKPSHKGLAGLQKLHDAHKGKKYFIKHRFGLTAEGMDAGVGGKAFINSSDVDKYIRTGKVAKNKQTKMMKLLENPEHHILQPDAGIQKSLFTRQGREFRVHTVGGKVVRGANTPRGGNVEDYTKVRAAENHMQRFLDKLPKHLKEKDMMMGADLALTDNGYKIVELNAGGLESGLLEPALMWNKHKDPFSSGQALLGSQKLYRHIQGRSHPVSAAAGAVATAGGAYGAGRYLQHKLDQ